MSRGFVDFNFMWTSRTTSGHVRNIINIVSVRVVRATLAQSLDSIAMRNARNDDIKATYVMSFYVPYILHDADGKLGHMAAVS